MRTEGNQDDLQEVQNYIIALDYGIERLKDLPLSLDSVVTMNCIEVGKID